MKALVVASLVAITTACSGGTVFKATVRQPDGSYALEVGLQDYTGLVTAVEATDGEGGDGALPLVAQDPADPNAVSVIWATGACDDVSMAFQKADVGYRLDVDAHERIGLGCTAQLLIRGLRIRFSKPIAADSIAASGGR